MDSQFPTDKPSPTQTPIPPDPQDPEDPARSRAACNCKRSKCLKLYCECYQAGQKCLQSCKCIGCENNSLSESRHPMEGHESEVRLLRAISEKDKSCNCKRSNCLKKYCECYHAGGYCSDNCKCEECKNRIDQEGVPDGNEVEPPQKKYSLEPSEIEDKLLNILKLVPHYNQEALMVFLQYLLN